MDKTVKLALIGRGRISVNHVEEVNTAPHAKLVVACDTNYVHDKEEGYEKF